jgi:hypothetical protein
VSTGGDEIRRRYLNALRSLDVNRNDIGPLLEVALDPAAGNEW